MTRGELVYREYRKLEATYADDGSEESCILTHYRSIDDKIYYVEVVKSKGLEVKRTVSTNIETENLVSVLITLSSSMMLRTYKLYLFNSARTFQ